MTNKRYTFHVNTFLNRIPKSYQVKWDSSKVLRERKIKCMCWRHRLITCRRCGFGPLFALPHANCHPQGAKGHLSISSRNMTIYVINFLICTEGSRSLAVWRCWAMMQWSLGPGHRVYHALAHCSPLMFNERSPSVKMKTPVGRI